MSDGLPEVLPSGRAQVHLAGFMGCGKSTVGKLLARRLLWNFLDLDGVIERHEDRSVARIFAEDGEGAFRTAERHVLRQVVAKPATVVALGGGTLIDPANRELLRAHALVVWLKCPLDALQRRCGERDDARPLWGDREFLEQRYAERLPGYETSDLTVDASGVPELVARAITEAILESS